MEVSKLSDSLRSGEIEIPATKLPAKARGLTIAVSRADLPEGPVGELHLEGSSDGVNWEYLGGCTFSGGKAFNRDGSEAAESYYSIQFEEQEVNEKGKTFTARAVEFPDTYIVRGKVKLSQPAKFVPQIRTFD